MDLDCFCFDISKICSFLLAIPGYGSIDINDHECVAMLLLNRYHHKHNIKLTSDNNLMSIAMFFRALGKFEFEDVRKLAAELCGRIHPQVYKIDFLFLLPFKNIINPCGKGIYFILGYVVLQHIS